MIDSSLLTFLPAVTRLRECPVMFISDCPLANEITNKEGYSSQKARIEFAELAKVGIPRTAIHATYLFNFRPDKGELSSLFWNKTLDSADGYVSWGKEKNCFILDYAYQELQRLKEEIHSTKPEIIIITGRWSLFFLTGLTKLLDTKKSAYGTLMKWRASSLELAEWWDYSNTHIVFPMLPIDSRYTLPDVQYLIKWDLERLKHIYKGLLEGKLLEWKVRDEKFIVPGSNDPFGTVEYFNICIKTLHTLLNKAEQDILYLSIDVETMRNAYVDCFSIAWSASEAICIPFSSLTNPHYWNELLELELYILIRELLLHKNVKHIGQNYTYDMQYFWRNMLIKVAPEMDTMIMGHVMFSTMEKNLGFLSSLYCKQHYWWKDEGKIGKDTTNTERWLYNCKDTTRTFEIAFKQKEMFDSSPESLQEALRFQTFDNLPTITNVMNRGVRQNETLKLQLIDELLTKSSAISNEFQAIFDEPVNVNSPEQLKGIFYELFKCKKQWKETKDTNGNIKNVLTLDEEALKTLYSEEILLRPIINILLDYKKLTKTASGLKALTLDTDNRLRCSYNVCGTDTYRYSSNANAFGSGTNLQVISKGKKLRNGTPLPNSKKLFIPDPGMTYFDIDLTAADAHIVAWESDCKELQEFMLNGEDLYLTVAKEYYRNPNLVKESPERQQFKGIIHGCLTEDHEILTKDGWINISEYSNEDIAVWNKDTWDITFEIPSKYHIYELENDTLVEIEGSALSQLVTTNHKIPYTTDDREIIFSKEVIELPKSASIPYVGFYSGNIVVDENYIKLIVALQADGHIQYTSKDGISSYIWHLGKERKINRLISILNSLNISYLYIPKEESSDEYVRISFKGYLEDYMKYPGKWLLNYCQDNLLTYVTELLHWDGSVDNSDSSRIRLEVSTINKESAEWMQTIIQLTGHGSKIVVSKDRKGNRQDLYRVSINNRKFHKCKNGKFNLVNNFTGKVYCFTTSTGFFLVRRNGHISITGNSNYAGSAKGLAERFNLLEHEVDRIQKYYFGRFPEVKETLKRLEQEVRRTKRITNIFGFQRWFFNLNLPTLIQTAAAWRPQSTVAIIINKGMVTIDRTLPDVQVLMQTHDSLSGQFPTDKPELKEEILKACSIELPYARPLIIPVNIGTSEVSWGDI